MPKAACTTLVLFVLLSPVPSFSQAATPAENSSAPQTPASDQPSGALSQPLPDNITPQDPPPAQSHPEPRRPSESRGTIIDKNQPVLKQSDRIAGILPNFTAVDSNTRLPPLTTREKFVLAMHDSTDYSSFLLAGVLAAKGLQSNATPQLGSGAVGFGRYYWRELADQTSGTFFTEAIIPMLTHEDPRYYTYGKRGFFHRAYYAINRTFITQNDAGGEEFNISEIGGNAAEAGLSNLYYPSEERGFNKTVKNFATQTVITAGANVLKEFWPDIRKNIFRIKDAREPPEAVSPSS